MNHDNLVRYVRLVADLFGLRDWTIIISLEHCDEDTLADTELTYGQRIARLRFNEKWAEWDPDDLRSTVVHELIHVHTEPTSELLADIAGATLDEKTAAAMTSAVSYSLERAVDQIAVAIAPYFPLPEDTRD
jgi:DNA-directed RNA polymerase subunit F